MSEKAYPPLPVSPGVGYGKHGYQDWAFNLADPEGMPSASGRRHGAVDWFADGGTPVHAARGGRVIEVRQGDNTGQVFGGTVKIQEPNGRVWVYRHVDPKVKKLGEAVQPSEVIAHVTPWRDGPDHLHMEVWRTLDGGYNFINAINPKDFEYTESFAPPRRYYIERIVDGETVMTWDYSRKFRRDAYYLLLRAAHPTWALRKYSKEL